MLTGPELLAKVKKLGNVSKSELVRACGYVAEVKGKERLCFTSFYEALLEAKGVALLPGDDKARPGRRLTNQTKVHFNGNLLIGKAYTRALGIEPGALFSINPSPDGSRITLRRVAEAAEAA